MSCSVPEMSSMPSARKGSAARGDAVGPKSIRAFMSVCHLGEKDFKFKILNLKSFRLPDLPSARSEPSAFAAGIRELFHHLHLVRKDRVRNEIRDFISGSDFCRAVA